MKPDQVYPGVMVRVIKKPGRRDYDGAVFQVEHWVRGNNQSYLRIKPLSPDLPILHARLDEIELA